MKTPVKKNASRADAEGEKETQLFRSKLIIEPPASRPNPGLIREEILAAQLMIDAYEDGKSERNAQIDCDPVLPSLSVSPLGQNGLCGFQFWPISIAMVAQG